MRQQLTMPLSFYRQLLGLVGLALISYFFTNAANAYLVNIMGHDVYGDYSISIAVLFSLTPFFSLGTTFLLIKELPPLIAKKNHQQKNIFLKWNINILIKSFIITALLLAISYLLQLYFHTHPDCIFHHCQQYRHMGRDMLYLVPVVLFLLWNSSLLNATKHTFTSNFIGTRGVTFLAALLFFLSRNLINDKSYTSMLMVLFCAFLTLWLLQCIFIYVVMIRSNQFSPTDIRQAIVTKKKAQQLRSDGIGLMINQVAYVCLGLTNIMLLEFLAPNKIAVGHYVIIMYITGFSHIMAIAMSSFLRPYLSGLDTKKRVNELQRMINVRSLLCLLWLLVSLVLFVLFKPLIFKLYLVNFPYATFSIIFLLIFYYLFGLIGISETICLYNNMNKKLYPVTVLQIAIQGAFAFWLIPHYSFLGAIIAFTISELVSSAICWVLLKRAKIDIKVLGFI